jgi:acyl carrier protein
MEARMPRGKSYDTLIAEVEAIVSSTLGAISASDPLKARKGADILSSGRYHIDSLAALEILTALEDHFGVEFPDDVINLNLFDSVPQLTGVVRSLLPEATRLEDGEE